MSISSCISSVSLSPLHLHKPNAFSADSGGAVEIPIQFEIKGSEDGIIVVDRYEFLLIENYLNEDTEITVNQLD